jgi:hypothetical protein
MRGMITNGLFFGLEEFEEALLGDNRMLMLELIKKRVALVFGVGIFVVSGFHKRS